VTPFGGQRPITSRAAREGWLPGELPSPPLVVAIHVISLPRSTGVKQGRPSKVDHPRNFVIAVVDDDQRILESLDELLESAGYAVRLFASAAALLERDNLAEIDCLISDIDLPKIDGFELLQLVHTARPELPAMLITGHPELVDRSSPISRSCYRLFRKPFDAEELLAAVNDAVRNSRRPGTT